MKIQITQLSRILIYLMFIAVLSVLGILLPELAREEAVGKVNPPLVWPYLLGAWVICIPIFVALHHVLKLLKLVDANQAFTELAVKALNKIKICTLIFSILIIVSAITVRIAGYIADPTEDFAPVFTIGFLFVFVSSIIGTFTAVLQRLLQNAIEMKSENELTV